MKNKILILPLIIVCSLALVSCNNNDATEVTVTEGTNMAVALSPDNSSLAMALQGTIWIIPADGGKAKSLTDEMGDCQEPAWSPDGEQITFHSYRDGNYHIWTINKDGSGLKQITSGISDDREPDWSPDGKSIIFSSDRSGNYDIWQIDLASGGLNQLSTDPANDFNPAFSNSDSKIAFVSQRSEAGIYILDAGVEKLAVPSEMRIAAPSWSKDDKTLAYVAFTGKSLLFDDKNTSYVYLANLENGSTQQISKGEEDLFPFRINWSKDNTLIYTADGLIKSRKAGQTDPEIIPFEASFSLNRKPYEKKKYDFDSREEHQVLGIAGPVVSSDGKKVAFAAKGDIFIQEINGKLTQLTNDSYVDLEPDWSPDNLTLAYISDRGGRMSIWLHDIKSNESRLLSNEITGETTFPSWSPDGKQIAFYSTNYMKKWGFGSLHIADVSSGKVREMSKGIWVPSKPSWSPDGKTIALMTLQKHSTRFREGFNYFMLVSTENGNTSMVSPDSTKALSMRNQNGPVWSPDGKLMAYVKDGVLWVIPVNSKGEIVGKEQKLTDELADNLSWTGDSKSIVYIATDRLKKIEISNGKTMDIAMDLKWKTNRNQGDYVIHAGKVFNGRDSTYQINMDIYVKGNRIGEIKPHQEHPSGVKVVDASDKVVMPGLFEMHTHQSSNDGQRLGKIWLSYGITSLRETGSDPYDALERKEAWEAGRRQGPRLFFTGGLTDGSRIAYGLANSVTEPNHIRMELDRAKRLDYNLMKTYVRMPDSIQKVLTEGAHKIGIPLSSHELYPATKYNVDAIEHLAGTSRRGYSLLLDANFRTYQDVVQLIVKSGINITPTACLRTGYFRLAKQYDELLNDERNRAFLDPEFLQNLANQTTTFESGRTPKADANYRALLKTIKQISDEGGSITAGTDAPFAPYGNSLHSELWVFVEAGISPFKALQTATINAARAVGVDKDLGSIESGKLADLIIVDGDPLHRIQDAMKVKTTIKNGLIYQVDQLIKK